MQGDVQARPQVGQSGGRPIDDDLGVVIDGYCLHAAAALAAADDGELLAIDLGQVAGDAVALGAAFPAALAGTFAAAFAFGRPGPLAALGGRFRLPAVSPSTRRSAAPEVTIAKPAY